MSGGIFILQEIMVLFGTALAVAWLFRILRAPTIIGFIFSGMIIGPSGLGLVASDSVMSLQQVGLVLLLFVIGIELSPKPLFQMGRGLVIAATLQVVITTVLLAGGYMIIGGALGPAIILGFGAMVSSTAIVLKQLSDRGEVGSVAGVLSTGVSLVQDIACIMIMPALALFVASSGNDGELTIALIKFGIATLAIVVLAVPGRRLLAFLLDAVVRTGGRELTALFAVLMACGGAWLASLVGWSPAFGACIAGFLLAEVDARHQLAADVMPFRDVFNALFFVSLGMMVDFDAIANQLPVIIALIFLIVLIKTMITAAAVRIAGWPARLALQTGLMLSSISEFGYVLGLEAARLEIISTDVLSAFAACAVGSMVACAILVPVAAPLSNVIATMLQLKDSEPPTFDGESRQHHVILVGYGTNGKNLAKVLAATHVPHCLIEMNPSLVQKAKVDGVPVIIGDATRMSILDHAGIMHAHSLVVAINDPVATARIVSQARSARKDLFILARTRFINEIDSLKRAGASRVIPEDFETSIEIAAQVLKELAVPDNIIEVQVSAIRAGNYAMLRGKPTDRVAQVELMEAIQSTVTRTHYLVEESPAANKTLAELNLRARSGVTIIAVVRSGTAKTNPPADYKLLAGDVLVLVGAHAELDAAKALLDPEKSGL